MSKDTWGPKTIHYTSQPPPWFKMPPSKNYQSEELKTSYPPQKVTVPELSVKMPLPWKMQTQKERNCGEKRVWKIGGHLSPSSLVFSEALRCHSEQERPESVLGCSLKWPLLSMPCSLPLPSHGSSASLGCLATGNQEDKPANTGTGEEREGKVKMTTAGNNCLR